MTDWQPVLEPSESISNVYSRPFRLEYTVTLAEFEIKTTLKVSNTSGAPDTLEFQALLHNYIRAPANETLVTPLRSVVYYDKTAATEQDRAKPNIESRNGVDVRKFTDSVYENAPNSCEATWPGGGIALHTDGFKDLVIWNPQEQGQKIGDMEDRGWWVGSQI